MRDWLARSGLDRRFLELTVFMTLATWLLLLLGTAGLAVIAFPSLFLVQAILIPLTVPSWVLGFRAARALRFYPRASVLIASWTTVLFIETVLMLWVRLQKGIYWTRPSLFGSTLMFLVFGGIATVGVLWLYRAETWVKVSEGR